MFSLICYKALYNLLFEKTQINKNVGMLAVRPDLAKFRHFGQIFLIIWLYF